ncbi:hypothetical protein AWB64_05878 [Caballeronia sordidicola]|uniref:Uncharacterized protein n=1 Tax=Caballeronia sordidicola TaxID=196367 RepID=A0A158IC52_CABSO|nr:hypothetical protein AWB64_05878 [Caballeronia sordidicola]
MDRSLTKTIYLDNSINSIYPIGRPNAAIGSTFENSGESTEAAPERRGEAMLSA